MLRSIVIINSVWQSIAAQCHAAGCRETGFRLLGERAISETLAGTVVDLVVFAAVGEGPAAHATAVRFAPDTEYQQAEIDVLVAQHPRWQFLGEGHLHPSSMPVPSQHDIQMAAEMALEPCYRLPNMTMPILIATIVRGQLALRGFAVDATFDPLEVREVPVLVDGWPQPAPQPAARSSHTAARLGSLLRRLIP